MSLDVNKIAHLARIKIAEADIPHYQNKLETIFAEVIDKMSKADDKLEGIQPMAHPFEANQRLREDVVSEDNQRDLFQENAPETEHGYYLVEKVID